MWAETAPPGPDPQGLDACVLPWGTPDAANADVFRRTLRHPRMMVASDGIYNIAHPHPRGYGCFARVLGRFVREQGVVGLGEAVYKMSGFPAKRFGLADRGAVAAGFAADLVLFDPLAVADAATFAEPLLPPVGVAGVWVNGVPVVLDGKPTGHLPGLVLRRQP